MYVSLRFAQTAFHRHHCLCPTLPWMRTGQYVLVVISLGNKLLSNRLCKCPKAFEVACVWFNLDLRSPGRWCEDCAKSKKNKWLALSQSNNNYETIHDMQQIKFYGFTLITAKNFHTQCNLVVWATPEVEIHTCLQQSTILMLPKIKISIHWLHSETPNIWL